MKKKIISAILVFVLISLCCPVTANSGSGVQTKIDQVKAVYPEGSYFTVASSNSPCASSNHDVVNGIWCAGCYLPNIPARGGLPSGASAGFESDTCCGFATYVYYCIFGHNYCNNTIKTSSPVLGDLVYTGSHYFIYLSEDSANYYVYDANGYNHGKNKVGYNNYYPKNAVTSLQVYHAANYDAVNATSPSPSTTNMTLQDLKNKFPQGAYWNHIAKAGHGYDGTTHYGDACGDVENTYTWTPCGTHIAKPYRDANVGEMDCNSFAGGIQCWAFSRKLASLAYGDYSYANYPDTTDKATAVSIIKPGDIVCYNYSVDQTPDTGHWIFITGVSGSTISFGECNFGCTCQIRWDRTLNIYSLDAIAVYSAPSALSTHTHSYASAITTNPTCTTDGVRTYTCSCGASYTETIPATGHTVVIDTAVEPTCLDIGLTEGSHCSECMEIFKAQDVLPALGHDYHLIRTMADSTSVTGVYMCVHCKDQQTETSQEYIESEWSEDEPLGILPENIESKMQYSASVKEVEWFSETEADGWTATGNTDTQYGDYGEWSDYLTGTKAETDTVEVETCTMYRYYAFACPNCGTHDPLTGGCSNCGYNLTGNHAIIVWTNIPYTASSAVTFGSYPSKMYTTSLGDGKVWYFSTPNFNDTAIGTKDSDSDAAVISAGYRYREREKTDFYEYYKWSDDSAWQDEPITADADTSVKTRTVYKYRVYPNTAKVSVTGILLNKTTATVTVGDTESLTATVSPSTATNKCVAWTSSDTAIATVSDGIVTAMNAGTATITAKTEDGDFTASCRVIVTAAQSGSKTAVPTANKAGGSVPSGTTVQLSCATSGASIYYTVNGDTPTALSTKYSGAIAINADTVIKAIAIKDGMEDSEVAVFTYKILDASSAVVTLGSGKAKAGQQVSVTVSLANNSGFANLGLEIGYDVGVMSLTEVTNSVTGASFTTAQELSANPYNMQWDSSGNVAYNGTLVTLTFEISAFAADGVYPITVSYYKGRDGDNTDGEDINYNADDAPLNLQYADGEIVVYSYIPGDINGDEKVNNKDATTLLRYLANWTDIIYDENALDVNGDGKISNKDATHLLKYLAGWNVELH